jgi:hypothetical protein
MNKLERNVMASVAVIYVTRRLTSQRALKAYALLLSFIGIVFFASVPHVLANFMHIGSAGLPAIYTFLLSAVTKTNFVVQVALIIGVATLVSLTRDLTRFSPRAANFAS